VLRPATVGVVDPASPVGAAEADVEVPDDASSLTGDATDDTAPDNNQ
jgi:hypothetical protein